MSEPNRSLRALLAGPTLAAGPALLGARLVREDHRGRRVGRIVELEAYIGEEDRASHARFGRTGRNEVMYGEPGTAYVYLVYGMHDCLNIVTERAGRPAALLVRAIEPLEGVELMRASRAMRASARRRAGATTGSGPRPVADARIASGPGLVCAALDIDRSMTGLDLLALGSSLRLEARPADEPEASVLATPRVGVAYAGPEWAARPWRFSIAGNASISRPIPDRQPGRSLAT